jgi:DNA-directed RNA polymerase subunit RPC12/RpoP
MRQLTFINLVDAYLCSDCEAIGDSAVSCPRCESKALFAVTRVIRHHRDSIRLVCVSPVDGSVPKAA